MVRTTDMTQDIGQSPAKESSNDTNKPPISPDTLKSSRRPRYFQEEEDDDITTYRKSLLYEPALTEKDAQESAHEYKKFQLASYELKNLPCYEDVTAYDVPEEEQSRLWELEIHRLFETSTKFDQPLFSSNGILKASQEGMQQLSDLADQIICNLGIVCYDGLVMKERSRKKRKQESFYQPSRWAVQGLAGDSSDDVDDDDNNVIFKRPTLLPEKNTEAYYFLVDYVSAIVCRFLNRCATSRGWHYTNISTIAKIVTKLKILERDPVKFAAISLENEEEQDDEEIQYKRLEFWESGPVKIIDEYEPETSDQGVRIYYLSEWAIKSEIINLFKAVLIGLHGRKTDPIRRGPPSFDTTSRIYRTGLPTSQCDHTLICKHNSGEYSATTDPTEIRFSRAAFDILLSNATRMTKTSKLIGTSQPPSAELARASWTWSCDRETLLSSLKADHLIYPEQGELPVYTVDAAVNLLVPLSLCSAHVTFDVHQNYQGLKMFYGLVRDESIEEFVDEEFEVNFSFRSAAPTPDRPLARPAKLCRKLEDLDILCGRLVPGVPLIEAAPNKEPRTKAINSSYVSWMSVLSSYDFYFTSFRKQVKHNTEDVFNEQMTKTHTWEIAETSITVPFKGFVAAVLGAGALFIVVGLILPLTGLIRIEGVDPSNLATYVWVCVLFFVLLAQSWYVPRWAWHDFLRGRIVCRTVSELANVTGLDPQYVLYKLLVDEKNSILKTRGPYNGMFTQRSSDGSDAFAIDVPCMTSTLFASGFVLFQGVGKYDWHILCVDGRGGKPLLTQAQRHDADCLGVPFPAHQSTKGKKKVLKFSKDHFHGEKILGLFMAERKFG